MQCVSLYMGPPDYPDYQCCPHVQAKLGTSQTWMHLMVNSGIPYSALPISKVKDLGLKQLMVPVPEEEPWHDSYVVGVLGNVAVKVRGREEGQDVTIYPYFVVLDDNGIPSIGSDILVHHNCCLLGSGSVTHSRMELLRRYDLPWPHASRLSTFTVNGIRLTGIVDTGMHHCYFPEDVAVRCGLEILEYDEPREMQTMYGEELVKKYCEAVTIMVGETSVLVRVHIHPHEEYHDVVFGLFLIIEFRRVEITEDTVILTEPAENSE